MPFSHCTILLISWLGLYPMNMCIWSLATFPDITSNSCSIAICLSRSLTRIATSPVNTFFRYFGTQTRCTFKSVFV